MIKLFINPRKHLPNLWETALIGLKNQLISIRFSSNKHMTSFDRSFECLNGPSITREVEDVDDTCTLLHIVKQRTYENILHYIWITDNIFIRTNSSNESRANIRFVLQLLVIKWIEKQCKTSSLERIVKPLKMFSVHSTNISHL